MEKGELQRFVTAVATILLTGFIGWQGVTVSNTQRTADKLEVRVEHLEMQMKEIKAFFTETIRLK